jgi:hypothetical protein
MTNVQTNKNCRLSMVDVKDLGPDPTWGLPDGKALVKSRVPNRPTERYMVADSQPYVSSMLAVLESFLLK